MAMGTNYYYQRVEHCSNCLRLEFGPKIHIGKSSGGWSFSFRGHTRPAVGCDEEPGVEIKSYLGWLDYFSKVAGVIVDECGVPMSTIEFKRMVARKIDGQKHAVDFPGSNNWLDEHGHSFSGYEFS